LSKRVLAAFLVTLFIVATFATVTEVQAHFTLGEQGPNGPVAGTYGSDVDPDVFPSAYYRIGAAGSHVAGHVAYVTPGLNYKPPVDQLPNYYSPDGAIITETSGALLFLINISDVTSDQEGQGYLGAGEVDINWDGNVAGDYQSHALYINIPPEFGVPEGWGEGTEAYIATSITNDWRCIWTGQWGASHDFAPNWWYVAISVPTDPDHADRGWLYPKDQDPYPDRQIRTGDNFAGCYWVWIGGLTAPSIAGKYFFKIFSTDPTWPYFPWEWYISFPPQNYPTLIVKGELDPGYISGRILYGGSYYYGYFYGDPILKPGRVIAEGEAIDPVTNEPTGRHVMAWGYFNGSRTGGSADGFYEIEGLAPGIYTLTAEAEGFPPVTLATQITVKRGQSVHGINIYVYPGAKITLKVNSKCPTGVIEFPDWVCVGSSDVGEKLGYYAYPNARYVVDIKDSEGNLMARRKGYWDITALGGNVSFTVQFGDPTSYEGAEVVWDGHVPDDLAHSISGLPAGVYYAYANVFGYVQLDEYEVVVPSAQYTGEIYREMDIFQGGKVHATVHFHNQEMPSAEEAPIVSGDLIIEAYDSEGTLRAWNYTSIVKNTVTKVTVDLIGDAWIPYGMPADTYSFKVWFPGYAQQEFPQHTVQLCTWNSFSFHLVKGGNITVTVYSRDWQSPAQSLNWLYPNAALRVYFYNSAGEYVGRKQLNQLPSADDPTVTDRVTFNFWGKTYGIDQYILYGWYPSGLPTDVYTIKAYTVGYVQRVDPEVWVQKASSTGDIPLYLYAGARIYITVNFKIEELLEPLDPGAWSYYFRINVFDEEGNLAAANITSVPQETDIPAGGTTQWTFQVVGFGAFSPPGRLGLPAAWPPEIPVEEGFIPTYAWGYYEPYTSVLHYDYGIDAGTYTLEVNDESGAYVQTATVAVTVSLMGSATVFLDMHKQAHISGTLYQRNYMGDYRTASWYTVELSGSPELSTASKDGFYDFWVPAGTYTLKVHLMAPDHTEAVVMQERTAVVTWGAGAGGQNFYLEEGGVPIPEFPAAGVLMLISALAASLYLLRWRKQAIVPMP